MNATLAEFNCSWCPASSERGGPFCSDEAGLHHRHQDWLDAQCNRRMGEVYCSSDDQETVVIRDDTGSVVQQNRATDGGTS